MRTDESIVEAISVWHINNNSNLLLVDAIPQKGMLLKPRGPRARNIAQVFAHLHNCRVGWVRFQDASAVEGIHRFAPRSQPSRTELKRALKSSGAMCERFFQRALEGNVSIKSFHKQPLRFMTYLIMHEGHHRGQIAFALKLAGLKIPQDLIWNRWIFGKD